MSSEWPVPSSEAIARAPSVGSVSAVSSVGVKRLRPSCEAARVPSSRGVTPAPRTCEYSSSKSSGSQPEPWFQITSA